MGCAEQGQIELMSNAAAAFLKADRSGIDEIDCGKRLKYCNAILTGESRCLSVRVVGILYIRVCLRE